jgi:hypothetical protein
MSRERELYGDLLRAIIESYIDVYRRDAIREDREDQGRVGSWCVFGVAGDQ